MIKLLKEKIIDKILDYLLGYIWIFVSIFLWNNNHIWLWRIILIASIILLFFTLYLFDENKRLRKTLRLNENPPLTEKEKLEIKLLEYINENNDKDIFYNQISYITDNMAHQIELLESLYYKNLITYKKIAEITTLSSRDYRALNVSITLDGKAYLKQNSEISY